VVKESVSRTEFKAGASRIRIPVFLAYSNSELILNVDFF
jgi:hypothetical protein